MKIKADKSTLVDRLAQVIKAIPKQITVPILEGVLIESSGELTLTCSDTHFTITTTIDDHEELEAGAVVIPASKLYEVIKKMPDKPIELEVDGAIVIVKCGSTKVKLPAMNADEFPRKTIGSMNLVTVNGNEFARLADGTKFAVSTNEATPILQGVCVVRTDSTLTAIATDRHRLAKRSVESSGEAHDGVYVIPVKLLDAVSKLKPSIVEIGFMENEIYMTAGAYQYTASLLDGSYPDTSKIIPQSPNITVLVNTERLLQTLELAEKIVGDKTKIAKFEVTDGELKVTAEYEGSSMEETIEATVEGENIKLSANAKYLIDALGCIKTERVEIWLTGVMAPIIIKAEGDETGLHLVLPYRTTS